MKILLTGATGYIGKRLLPILVHQGHFVYCLVRDKTRFNPPESFYSQIEVLEADLLNSNSLEKIPEDIEVAYYLVHSMSTTKDYANLEKESAENFCSSIKNTSIKQVIYLSGIVNDQSLSKHLQSRKSVEDILAKGNFYLTTFRAGIIIGSGSASFEIIRDLVEKLPVMITPRWLNTKCQPIGVSNVISFLTKSLLRPETYDQSFDIGGPDILTYKEMLLGFAKVRGMKRYIYVVSVMTPKISSYWLYFITSISFNLASALVDSMKVEVICKPNHLHQLLGIELFSYEESLQRTFTAIVDNHIISSWKDSLISGVMDVKFSDYMHVPVYGCFKDRRVRKYKDRERSLQKIWEIGGDNGWYAANWLWVFRGFIDKLVGGVGLRRGRTKPDEIAVGDAIDFWRVLYANKEEGRLLLFAEMKLPGEAWLEFRIKGDQIVQTATLRPKGLFDRIYWYTVFPLHEYVFRGMIRKIAQA
jgi:uncharacterized protein YbjT (DUF2867 family)